MTRKSSIKDYPEPMVAQWALLYRNLKSYSAVARRTGFERREISSAINKYENKQSGLGKARPAALTELYNQHLDDLKTVAFTLLKIFYNSSTIRNLRPGKVDAITKFTDKVMNEIPVLYAPPMAVESDEIKINTAMYKRLAKHRADIAIEGFYVHLPDMERNFDEWIELLKAYGNAWEQLKNKAEEIKIPEKSFEDSIKLAIHYLDNNRDIPPSSMKTTNIEHHAIWLLNRAETNIVLQKLYKNRVKLDKFYLILENKLTYPGLDKALIESHCRYCPC